MISIGASDRMQRRCVSSGITTGHSHAPVFFIVAIVLRIVFPLIPIVLAGGSVSLALAKP
jgi:hypothetical protein